METHLLEIIPFSFRMTFYWTKDITNYTLGHTLDEIADYGSNLLFGEIALENDLLGSLNHLYVSQR